MYGMHFCATEYFAGMKIDLVPPAERPTLRGETEDILEKSVINTK
jgi:hypothetical protein